MEGLIVILILLQIVGLRSWREAEQGSYPYSERSFNGRAWRMQVPDQPKESIRLFLDCLVGGMGFSSKITLKFHPEEKVMDVYRPVEGG